MNSADPIVHETRIDGITTLWVDTPGPATASLWFRVGVWDESVLTRGVSHLVEHLALHSLRRTLHPFGGSTSGNYVSFYATGTSQELQRFFRVVSASLRAVPVERLDTEASVLMAESDGDQANWFNEILSQFFGPNGPGLFAYAERGLEVLRAEDVQSWCDRYFVRDNAVLLVSGKPPATFELDLPEGPYAPYVLPSEAYGYRPQALERLSRQKRGACFGALCSRSTDAVLGLEVLNRRLTEHLRHELGLVYSVTVHYLPLDDRTAYVYVGADGREGQVRRMARAFLEVLSRLQHEDPTQEELDAVRTALDRQEDADPATRAHAELARVGFWRLLRYPCESSADLRKERVDATPRGVGQALRDLLRRAGVVVPDGVGDDLPEREPTDDVPLQGRLFRRRMGVKGGPDRLIVGADGIAMRSERRWLSIPWDGLALVEHRDAPQWLFLDRRGAYMSVNVDGWLRRRKLRALLEQHAPRHLRMPERAVRSLRRGGDASEERAAEADAVVRELRAQGLAHHRIYDALCERGFSDDEAWDALER